MKTRNILLIFAMLTAVTTASAQVKIYGNVYGGGEKAQVIEPNLDSIKSHVIQDADLATLFTKKHTYTTYVRLGENTEVYGRTFGGGKGHKDSLGESAGRVTGQTDVVLDGATVWSEIFGGGENADVRGNTLLHFEKGKAGHNAFGGGLGLLDGTDATPDNQRAVLASSDVKLIPANYALITNDTPANLATLKGYYNDDGTIKNTSDWLQDKITGESFVVFDGTDDSYTQYEFKKARTFAMVDGKPVVTETDQYNPANPSQLFSINHNIYGGGMTASKIEGKTFVYINHGMVNQEMMNYTVGDEKVWSNVYNSIANAQFCVFGGGYGYYSQVNGDTNVTMDILGSGTYKYIEEFTQWFAGKGKEKYHWDTNTGTPENIYKAADESTWSHGAPGRSCMDVIGGGYNGRVLGSTNITIGGDVIVRKVYGGGYYASVGNTNVNIKSGIFNRVYGGGLIGNVYGKATLNIGQQGLTDDIHRHNLHLLVKDAVYGGNDVSGTVGTTAAADKENPQNKVHYNVYSPYDNGTGGYYGTKQTEYGVRLNMYGGLILGDVYGAGNGNHPGYGNPDYMEFDLSQHPSENYRQLTHPGTKGTVLVYKYRPRTGRVVMNLQGNAGKDFKDDPQVDKLRIWGRTFGGGNSCNVGIWNGLDDDNTEVYAETGSWHPGDNFQGQGTITLNIGNHVQLGNRNDSHETPNGLFMGSNGEHMVTQHLDKEKAKYYHQYWDSKAGCYYPGFVVYEEDGNTPIKRSVGLKAFTAFINNILTKSDNVTLNIANNVQDIWMSNFVGGGYRGSMQAATENGRFAYALPKGVTIGHAVVGGAFNAHIIYRVYATNYGAGTYKTDAKGNYLYETIEPGGGVKVISKAEAETAGETEYDYIKKLYAEGHEGEDAYKTGYLRYNFDGGMMGHESGPIAKDNGSRCNQVRTGGAEDFTKSKSGSEPVFNKDNALVYLDLRNCMEPIVETKIVNQETKETKKTVHGGIVYGGCFATGYVDGDSWVDYRCSLSPLCTDADFFDKTKAALYEKVDNFTDYNALNVYGAGYGADSHIMGDAYLRILHNGTSDNTYDYPFIYNAFGGGNNGTVAGNTNVYYNVGSKGTLLGSLYAGGYKGEIGGNTKLELAGGLIINAYGGSREANIKGATHVWAYDGQLRDGEDEPEASTEHAPLLIGNLYGGNDISGTISGSKDAKWTESRWNVAATSDKKWTNKTFSTCVQIGGTEHSTRGYPMIGNVFAGGNGIDTPEGTAAPDVATALLEVSGGTVLRAFGGGNKATITGETCIFTQATDNHFATFNFTDYHKTVLNHTVLDNINSGYKWEGTVLKLDPYHIVKLYGGNNLAPMAIQPTWNLAAGSLEYVYSGGNLGDMTHPNGIHIDVTSADIRIKNLFGGCRMADVKPTVIAGHESDFTTYWTNTNNYGATVNCIGGYIGNVYGGNDISGTVAYGTKVVIDGAVDNDVYCAGNGNYLYKWDATVDKVTETKEGDDVIYKVPAMAMFGGTEANNTQKLLTINAYRPSVNRSALVIAGDATDPSDVKVAFVKGNVYCGGNASTVTGKSATDLTIGSHVNIHGLFMGSDGYDYSQQEYIAKFEKLNGFDMTAKTDFRGLTYGEVAGQVPATAMTEAEEKYYPTLVALYMKSVEMESLPNIHIDKEHVTNAYIGTWCGGGNRGSMTTQETVTVEIPSNITIYDKVVAGCMDARMEYVGQSTIEDVGGYYRPLTSGTTKLNYTINAKFLPRYMSVPTGMDEAHRNPEGDDFLTARGKYFLYENKTGDGAATQYNIGNNIYGGCYEAGDILGDIVLNVNSNLLEEPLKEEGITQPNREKLNNTSKNEVAAFNVYGAGMGMNSNVWGNVTINMKGNANNVYGGGRSGTLIGNATINMQNGIVYRHIIGGSDAGYLYGSTQIAVGYPTRYTAKQTGTYTLSRADKWNTSITNHDGTKPVVDEIKLVAGDVISEAIYEMLNAEKKNDTYFDATTPVNGDWANTNIYIGGGVYGGGYALATGSTVYAGDTTVKKYTTDYRPKNPTTGDKVAEDIVGYGGNATIMVADDPANATTGAKDHITISTLTPVVKTGMSSKLGYFTRSAESTGTNILGDPVYTWTTQADGAPVGGTTYYELSGNGGVYGDGHLSFVEGFRSADIQRYGYAGSTPQNPKLLNTFQRMDVTSVKDCCVMLQGARDFATNATDATIYSISRIRELQMKSSLGDANLNIGTESGDDDNVDRIHDTARIRNYIGFYNNVHYIGAIKSDVDFSSTRYNESGIKQSDTYQAYKAGIINTNYPYGDDNTKYSKFRTRNLGTAKNMIGINNGYTLKIQNVQTTNGENNSVVDNMYYGPVVGVFEAKLLSLVPGEGGGYIYADNIHGDNSNFLNTSGNFVFPSTVTTGDVTQYIVDDCFPKKFSGTATNEEKDAHYWYVEGNKYWYNASITGYTADNANMTFNMDNADQIVTLFDTKKDSKVKLKSITWEHAHTQGYECDIANTGKSYAFSLSVSADGKYNEDGGYLNPMSRTDVNNGETPVELTYATGNDNGQGNPLLGVRLIDNVENNGAGYYDVHLKEPCTAKIVLESVNNEVAYTYTINLNVIYLKGPSVTGTVMIDNCALPGELIRASVKNLNITTNDGMPVTRTYWRVVNPTDGNHTEEIARVNTTEIDPSKIDLKALYKYNGWNLQYVIESQNNQFPLNVSNNFGAQDYDPSVDGKFKTLLVHNYHKMADVQARQSNASLQLDPHAGARIYINNVEDLAAFGQWINDGNTTEGIHFYLQNSLALPAEWEITKEFKGILHGDGYILDASDVTKERTLFGENYDKDNAKVYNLGVAGGTITSVAEAYASDPAPLSIINCFDSNNEVADLLYGKKTYDLCHHFSTADGDKGYVQQYYTGDDWRYARTTADNTPEKNYLRTGAPAYGSIHTAHIIMNDLPAYAPIAHDYLFFGQALTPSGDKHPVHIANNEVNRVLETEGYYNSKNDEKFYYNAATAWAMQPGLTAVRFDNTKKNGEQQKPAAIGATADVTRNLLVYEADDALVDHFSESFFHVKGSKGTNNPSMTKNVYTCAELNLHDKQDFNAPYSFRATTASYVRNPGEETGYVVTPGTAWESICLPFAASKATLSTGLSLFAYDKDDEWNRGERGLKDDITFFYGTDESESYDNGNHIRHEYWLREFTGKSTVTIEKAQKDIATFHRPAENTFAAYTPYIVSFPGSRFYEFDMTGQSITFSATSAEIDVTDDAISNPASHGDFIHVGAFRNDIANAGKYAIVLKADAADAAGDRFEKNKRVYPFRTYLSPTVSVVNDPGKKGSQLAKRGSIFISQNTSGDEIKEDHDERGIGVEDRLDDNYLRIYAQGRVVTVISGCDRRLNCTNIAGYNLGVWDVKRGTSHFTLDRDGIYVIGGVKVAVK